MTKKSLFTTLSFVMCAMLMATSMTGCKKKKEAPIETTPVPAATNNDGGLPNPGDTLWTDALSLGVKPVYFDFDRSDIRADQVATLEANAAIIKSNGKMFRVQGHCDERGTQEYNMALGERRALAVRDYLIRLGCDGGKLVTVSFGEEVPAEMGSSEAAWAKNRRAQFDVGNQ